MKLSSNIRSLQWFLPVLLAILGLLIVIVYGLFEFLEGQHRLEQKTLTDIRSQMTRLQATLGDSLNRGDKYAAQREVAYQGVNPAINRLMLLDPQGMIILSMNYSDLGQQAKNISSNFEMPDQRIRLGFLLQKKNHLIQAYFPTQINTQSNSIRNHQNSWLYMAFNGTYQYEELLQDIKFKVLILAFGVILITLLTWWILKTMVVRPLIELGKATQKIGHEKQRVDFPDSWFNEISILAKSMGQMTDNLYKANDQLIQHTKKQEGLIQLLEDKNAELERFAYTVSHDLKSPLVTVKGFVGLLRQDIKDNNAVRVSGDLEQIAAAADKMAILLDDLLELSRIGRVVNKPEKILLSDLFAEVVITIQGQIKQADAIIKIQPDMPAIYADKHRMLEVAQNLLDNAIKFSQANIIPEVEVTATIDQNKVVCCVADNGIGIKVEYHNRVFGLFNRLDPSFEGTGIGLALVKRIIEVHNGNIRIESNGHGQGTRFYFTLAKTSEISL